MADEHFMQYQGYEVYHRQPLSEQTRSQLKAVTTSTLAGVLAKKGYHGLFLSGVHRVAGNEPMIGLALTLRLLPARPDCDFAPSQNAVNPQRVAVEGVFSGDVLVVDARGSHLSGVLGDVLATRVAVLGGAGILTDGGMRDVAQLGPVGIPIYCALTHGAASPVAHTYADVNLPVSCAGARVNPGDVIVGDADGAVVIPRQIAEDVAQSAFDQEQMESWVLQRIQQGASSVDYYPPDEVRMDEYRAWKAQHRA
jgi:5-oxopent-3-ene-1,2,5-tricarboxylate decarboxylase/2-hydroxyhepta-2,4-diene-1,7-dioate isomerase